MYLADFHCISDSTVKMIISCTRKEPRDHEIIDKTLHHTTLKHDAFEPGASGLPYSSDCTPPVTVPAVIGTRAVWRQNIKNNQKRQQHPRPWRPTRQVRKVGDTQEETKETVVDAVQSVEMYTELSDEDGDREVELMDEDIDAVFGP